MISSFFPLLSPYRLDAWHDFKTLVGRIQWRRGHILDASLCHKEKDSSLESVETSPFSDNSMETYQERQLAPSVKNTRGRTRARTECLEKGVGHA